MNRRKALAGLGVAAIAAAFPYGPLFAWSPVKPGYEHLALERADVFFPAGAALPEAYRTLDSAIADAEAFHGLTFRKRVTVVHSTDWRRQHGFMPFHRSRGIGGLTLETGTVIYITPKVAELGFDHGEFLRHELSHAIRHQNSSLLRHFDRRHQWVLEGMCVAFARQSSYVTREEFLEQSKTVDLPAVVLLQAGESPAGFSIRYGYMAWRYFNEYLRERHGSEAYMRFQHAYLERPKEHDRLFLDAFGLAPAQSAAAFAREVREGSWAPAP